MKRDQPHILAVEDNPDTQKLLRYILQPKFDLELVAGVEEAVRAAEDEMFDLLLLDINLGEEETGLDLLNRIRGRETYRNVPALALTAYALPGDRERFFEQGFDGYVSKPFTRNDLISQIEKNAQ